MACEMSSSTANPSQNQSKPFRPTTGVHMMTYMSVVNGRNMIPSSGQNQLPSNGARNWFGRAIQRRMSANRGNMPAKTTNRQPMSFPPWGGCAQLTAASIGGSETAPRYDDDPDGTDFSR